MRCTASGRQGAASSVCETPPLVEGRTRRKAVAYSGSHPPARCARVRAATCDTPGPDKSRAARYPACCHRRDARPPSAATAFQARAQRECGANLPVCHLSSAVRTPSRARGGAGCGRAQIALADQRPTHVSARSPWALPPVCHTRIRTGSQAQPFQIGFHAISHRLAHVLRQFQ